MNPLFQEMNNSFLSRIMKFQKTIKGNPQEQIQQLINSGKITQEQYNYAVQQANAALHNSQELRKFLGM